MARLRRGYIRWVHATLRTARLVAITAKSTAADLGAVAAARRNHLRVKTAREPSGATAEPFARVSAAEPIVGAAARLPLLQESEIAPCDTARLHRGLEFWPGRCLQPILW